jgi:hypothetical protein
VALRRAGKPWGPARVVKGNGGGYPWAVFFDPRVAITADGRAAVAWVYAPDEGTSWIRWTSYSARGRQGSIREMSSSDYGNLAGSLAMSMSPSGALAFAWTDIDAQQPVGAVGSINGGTMVTPLAAPGSAVFGPDVAIDDAGNTVWAWERGYADNSTVETVTKAAGAPLGPLDTIAGESSQERAETPVLGIDGGGQAIVAFNFATPTKSNRVLYSTRSVTGGFAAGTWSTPALASRAGEVASAQAKAIVATGPSSATLLYRLASGRLVATSRSGGSFGGHQVISTSGAAAPGPSALSANDAGVVTAGFPETKAGKTRLIASIRPPGSLFGARKVIARGLVAGFADSDVDAAGNAYATYAGHACPTGTSCVNPDAVAGHRAYDAVGPTLRKVRQPKGLRPRVRGRFRVVGAADLVSRFTVRWKFGDGTWATGRKVTHAYAAPGKYRVKVLLEDAVGNKTRRVVKVKVKWRS